MEKTKLFIFGLCGKMGKAICECAEAADCVVTGGFDRVKHASLPTFGDVKDVDMPFDVIADFSRPETLDQVIRLAKQRHAPTVLATTGYSAAEQQKIDELAKHVPVFQTGNMSIGINVIMRLVSEAVKLLGNGFDVEITEKHHNQKADAPSGTAKMLADSVAKSMGEAPVFVYGREGANCKRKKGDIGIHAVRGGTIVGEHEVAFYGEHEVVTVSHSAQSRAIFANGALRAAKFLQKMPAGKYNMDDLLSK